MISLLRTTPPPFTMDRCVGVLSAYACTLALVALTNGTMAAHEETQTGGCATSGNCPLPSCPSMLFYVDPAGVVEVNATAEECCALCAAGTKLPQCATWSWSGNKWTPSSPCHLSRYAPIRTVPTASGGKGRNYTGGSAHNSPPAPAPAPTPRPVQPGTGTFWIDTSSAGRRQVFEGIQVELMSDSIGSNNQGMPGDGRPVPDDDITTLGVPHDLTPSERVRFATEVMSGVRTIRLAMGLYLRGLSPDNRSIVGRWPSQMSELKQLQDLSGVEGWAPEYWSPPPGWKSTRSYYSGTLASFNASFLSDFCDGVVRDVKYLQQAGLAIKHWGLQNEPNFAHDNATDPCPRPSLAATYASSSLPLVAGANAYSRCSYTQCSYYWAFKTCAAKIRQLDPSIRIHANSATGQLGASAVANDPATLPLVDAWTWHTVGSPSSATFGNKTFPNYGKLDYTNEMEYQPGSGYAGTAVGTVSCVNIFLNTLTFKNSPTGVMMLHAMKPTTNLEALGYGWTWWQSTGSKPDPALPNLKPNHFTYNYWTWNSVAPFVKTVPWNSHRLNVMEDKQRLSQRVVAFETPEQGRGGPLHVNTSAGKLIVVLTNEASITFNTTVRTTDGAARVWAGYSYEGSSSGAGFNVSLGAPVHGASFEATLPAYTIQWWYEQ